MTVRATVVLACVLLLLGTWLLSPRFAIDDLSLIDDWWAEQTSPQAFDDLLRLDYSGDSIGDQARYRPGWTAVWNYLVWQTLGAPDSLIGPNVWAVWRLALFVLPLLALPVVLWPRVSTALASAGMTALILTTPHLPVQFARLGPTEPILVGSAVAGAGLVLLAAQRVIRSGRRAWPTTAALAGGGITLWAFGVYQKEASICALVGAPFVYVFLDRRWRERRWIDRALIRHRPFQLAAVALVLPLVHMATKVVSIGSGEKTAYGTPIPRSLGGIADRLRDALSSQWEFMEPAIGTDLWSLLLVATTIGALWTAIRRRPAWLALGLLATAWAVMLFQGLGGGGPVARYYLAVVPLVALAGIALAVDQRRLLVAVVWASWFVAVSWAGDAHENVEWWAAGEQQGVEAVDLVAQLQPTHCPVYVARLDAERADALPVLLRREREAVRGPCRSSAPRLVAGKFATTTDDSIFAVCASPGWQTVQESDAVTIYACERLRAGLLRGEPVAGILAGNRLLPGVRLSEAGG